MRCLYCGKHLPLLRKLTGGGEFCSDAHRDKYHEEYNRLAVSRLLQAQSRPEETRQSKRVESVTERVREPEPEPEMEPAPEFRALAAQDTPAPPEEAFPGSYIDEFKMPGIRPASPQEQNPACSVSPLFLWEPEVVLPTIAGCCVLSPGDAGFIAVLPDARRTEYGPAGVEAVDGHEIEPVLPGLLAAYQAEHNLGEAGPLAYYRPEPPTTAALQPLALTLAPLEPAVPEAIVPSIPSTHYSGGLASSSAIRLTFSPVLPEDSDTPDFGALEQFSHLLEWRPQFDPILCLAQPDGAGEDDVLSSVPDIPAIEPKRETPQSQPRANLVLKQVVIRPIAPSGATLAVGFDSMAVSSRPQVFQDDAQPLRPKMALEPVGVSSPSSASRGRAGSLRKPQADAPKILPRSILDIENTGTQEGPKVAPRSMLHLDEEPPADVEAGPDSGTLLGKLGGLFGRKSKSGG